MVFVEILYQSHSVQWYFVDHGQPRGPHSFEELQSFHSSQTILNETLCWREGLPTWERFDSLSSPETVQPLDPIPEHSPYAPPVHVEARPTISAPSAETFSTSHPLLNPEMAVQAPVETSPDGFPESTPRICVQCGKSFLEEDMLKYQHFWVCGPCKPAFMEAVREGLVNRSQLSYGGIVSRVGAYIVDLILLSTVNIPTSLAIQGITVATIMNQEHANPIFQIMASLFSFCLFSSYYFIFIAWLGATPGIMFFGLRVVRHDGSPLSVLHALAWVGASTLVYFTCYLGVLTAIWDPEKRALQDMICNTRLVYKRV